MSGQITWFSIATLLIGVLFGGLAGALLNNIWKSVQEHRQRPRLNVVFNDEDKGCNIETATTPAEHWVRVKIINQGRSTARGVSVCATKLTLDSSSTGITGQFLEKVFDLKVANYKEVSPFVLAPNGGYRYLDVCHIKDGEAFFTYDLRPDIGRLRVRGYGMNRGAYGAELFVSADNAEAFKKIIRWEWDGAFHGLKKLMVV